MCVLDQGQIVGVEPYQELLAQGGLYLPYQLKRA